MPVYPILTIAGTDPTAGAGALADLRAIAASGGYGMAAITAVTVQNTLGVSGFMAVKPETVRGQIAAVFDDIPPLAVKSGMLGDAATVNAVADALTECMPKSTPYILDPVMVSTSGHQLLDDSAVDTIVTRLFPLATLVTPNRHEAFRLTGVEDPRHQIDILREMGCRSILVKGGDSARRDVKIDYLYVDGCEVEELVGEAVDTHNTHGTGCTLSALIACYVGQGHGLVQAVRDAKTYVNRALRNGINIHLGHGHGPCLITVESL